MSFSDEPRESRPPRAPRKARARPSLKMQAIGLLSRREHSRQELRTKLLAAIRQREREEAVLAAASQAAENARAPASNDPPSNGIDDAFAPSVPPPVRVPPARARASTGGPAAAVDLDPGAASDLRIDRAARPGDRAPARSALDGVRLASGDPIPERLRSRLASGAPLVEARADADAPLPAGTVPAEAPAAAATVERPDPEAAVDQLLDWLVAHRYLSESRFIDSRLHARASKRGALLIKHELSRHGLAMAPEQAAALRETEFARAQALWRRKFGAVAADARERARQARFLLARGFASDVVRRIVGGGDEG